MLKLFILEDDRLSMAVYEAYFKDQYELVKAHSRSDFEERFLANKPEVALIDLNIKDPDHTGIDLVNSVYNPDCQTKFIILTAYSLRDFSLPEWSDGYHQKPVRLKELSSQIKELNEK